MQAARSLLFETAAVVNDTVWQTKLAGLWTVYATNRVANCSKPSASLSTRCRGLRDRLPSFMLSSITPGADGRELISRRSGPHGEVSRLPVQRKTVPVSLGHPRCSGEISAAMLVPPPSPAGRSALPARRPS